MGKDVTLKKDLELKPEDTKDMDILISLGKFQINPIGMRCYKDKVVLTNWFNRWRWDLS